LKSYHDFANSNQIRSFNVPIEASSCAVSSSAGILYFGNDDGKDVYVFETTELTAAPTIRSLGEVDDDVTGLAVYIGKLSDYILVAQTDVVAIYSTNFILLGSMKITGAEDIEIQGISVYQGESKHYPGGSLLYAFEDEQGKGFGTSSLKSSFELLN